MMTSKMNFETRMKSYIVGIIIFFAIFALSAKAMNLSYKIKKIKSEKVEINLILKKLPYMEPVKNVYIEPVI